MADDTNSSEFKLNLDVEEAIGKAKEFSSAVTEIGEGGSGAIGALSNSFIELGIALAPVAIAVGAFKLGLDLSMEAEQIKSITVSFEALAKNAGLSAGELKKSMEDASGGLLTTADLLKSGNKAIVELGQNASRLGEIMTVARQASAVFGGSITENFENITRAVGTGNTRLLKHIGLVVNADEAYADYAKQLGVSVDSLTTIDKQQAILNATLDKAHNAYKGINTDLKENTNLWTKFKVTTTEVWESFVLGFDRAFGPTTSKVLKSLGSSAKSTALLIKEIFPASESEKTETRVESLKLRIEDLKKLLDQKQNATGFFAFLQNSPKDIENLQKNLASAEEELQKIDVQEQHHAAWKAKSSADEQKADENAIERAKLVKEQKEKFEHEMDSIHAKNAQAALKIDKQVLDSDIKNAKTGEEYFKLTQDKKALEAKKFEDEIFKLKADTQAKIDKITQNEAKLTTKQLAAEIAEVKKANDVIEKLEKLKTDSLKSDQQELLDEKIKGYQQEEDKATNVYEGITAASRKMATQAEKDITNFGKQGELVINTFSNEAISGLEAIGSGAQSAGDAMKGFMFSSIGDIAEAEGRMLMLSGLMNPGQMAAGAALVVLGSWLKSQGKSDSSSSIPGGGGDSSISVAANPATVANPETGYVPPLAGPASMSTTNNMPQRSVVINIQGHILSGPRSADWLVAQIRQAADASDFKVQSIGGGL